MSRNDYPPQGLHIRISQKLVQNSTIVFCGVWGTTMHIGCRLAQHTLILFLSDLTNILTCATFLLPKPPPPTTPLNSQTKVHPRYVTRSNIKINILLAALATPESQLTSKIATNIFNLNLTVFSSAWNLYKLNLL
jgi:hypothetical protein